MLGRLHLLEISVVPTFQALLARTESCAAVGVDIPIGVSEGPPREADKKAREFLREPRGRSVFRAPCWPVLDETTDDTGYKEVCEASRRFCLKKNGEPAAVSQQAWRIMPKVREANLAITPALQKTIVEVHPEVSLCELAGRPMQHKKKRSAGKKERAGFLSKVFEDDVASVAVPKGAAKDDFFDACAAAWTARRLALGEAERLPADPPVDRRGLRMEIVY